MKALVPIKRVVDYNVKVRAKADQSDVDIANVKMSVNPFDEIAVEEAVRLKEAGKITEIIVLTIGPEKAQEQLRTAMAIGADRGILVKIDSRVEPLAVAKTIRHFVEKENPDVIIMGKQAIDGDYNQTGQMLAALLDWPQATFASKVEIDGAAAKVTREIDGGLETLEIALPGIITTDLRLNEPRYAKLPDIMKAKQKPLEIVEAAGTGVDMTTRLEIIKVSDPAVRQGGVKVASVDELLDKLKNEAKVL